MKVFLFAPSRQPENLPPHLVEVAKRSGNQIGSNQELPYDLGYIAAMLKQRGHEAIIWDEHSLGCGREQTLQKIKGYAPDFIGVATDCVSKWGCHVPTVEHADKAVAQIKEIMPKVPIVIMGPQLEANPRLTKAKADVIIKSEYEEVFMNVFDHYPNLENVLGIIYFKDGKEMETPAAPKALMENFPVPDYSSIPLEKYHDIIMESTRGCPFSCTFCMRELIGIQYRPKNYDKIIEEIRLISKHADEIFITDAIFLPQHVFKFTEALKKNDIHIKYRILTRPQFLTEDVVKALAETGCSGVTIGTETASNQLLKNVNKMTTVEETEKAVNNCKKYGLNLSLFMMLFLPGETTETLKETLAFAKRVDVNIATEITTPIPGTKLWKQALESGELKTGDWVECLEKAGTIGTKFTPEEVQRYKAWFFREIAKHMAMRRPLEVLKRVIVRPGKIIEYMNFFITDLLQNPMKS